MKMKIFVLQKMYLTLAVNLLLFFSEKEQLKLTITVTD